MSSRLALLRFEGAFLFDTASNQVRSLKKTALEWIPSRCENTPNHLATTEKHRRKGFFQMIPQRFIRKSIFICVHLWLMVSRNSFQTEGQFCHDASTAEVHETTLSVAENPLLPVDSG